MADDEFAVAVADPAPEAPPEADAPAPDVLAEPAVPAAEPKTEPNPLENRVKELEKQLNDAKSQAVGRTRADQRQNELKDEIASLKRTISVFMANQVKGGDPEALAEELTTIETEAAQQAVTRAYEENYDRATSMLRDVLSESGLDPAGSELAETRQLWNAAKASQSSEGHFEAVAAASKAVSLAQRARIAQAATAPIDGHAPPERANNMEMAVAPSGAGASVSDDELYKRYGRGEVEYTAEVRAAARRLGYT